MRRIFLAVLLALVSIGVQGQAWRDGKPLVGQGQSWTTAPATCTIGQLGFKTNATAGSNVYGCTAANTWTVQGGGTPTFPGTVSGATSGGIPYFSSTSAWASSGLLGASAVVLGGGAGATPFTSSGFTYASNVLGLQNGATAQKQSIFKTWTDASNNESLNFDTTGTGPTGSAYEIYTTKAGTGSFRNIGISAVGTTTANTASITLATNGSITMGTGAANNWMFASGGGLTANTDNSYDIGAAGATRPRTGYFGTSVVSGILTTGDVTGLTLTTGAIGMKKITASASAPGASGGKLELVCGTNAGSAKIIAAAGTSATAVTVIDNIGSGVTGC